MSETKTKSITEKQNICGNFIAAQECEITARMMGRHIDYRQEARFYDSAIVFYSSVLAKLKTKSDFLTDEKDRTVRSPEGKMVDTEYLNAKIKELHLLCGKADKNLSGKLNAYEEKEQIFQLMIEAGKHLIKGGNIDEGAECLRVGCQYGISHVKTLFDNKREFWIGTAILNGVLDENGNNPNATKKEEIIEHVRNVSSKYLKDLEEDASKMKKFMRSNGLDQ